jgi:hypothetical protein
VVTTSEVNPFDVLIFGCHEDGKPIYAARTVSRQTAVYLDKQRCIQAGRRQVQVAAILKPTLLQAMARPLRMDIPGADASANNSGNQYSDDRCGGWIRSARSTIASKISPRRETTSNS